MDAAFLNDSDHATLRHSVLCAAMSDEEMADILASGTITRLARSEYLFEQGDRANNLFLILEGWAQITRDERDGSRTLIATFHKGDSLAEAAAFLGKAYPASCQAMTDLRVLSVNGAKLLDVMQHNRAVLAQSLASVYHKLHDLVDDVEWLKSRTIRERLAKFLLDQTKGTADGQEFALPYSKSLIAAKIGTSPQQLSRTFTQMQDFGVAINGQTATIEDSEVLRALIRKS
ncbi:Crp/Fnr family transcriptional regulator [Sulfitobacter sp. JB4-11]|uniref:Crp/Fnr family transcriptional regulator n=1 Tax=Sulfitobacter rhodophyticola TaxID=3238304 RepID=UPI003511D313